MNNNQSEQPKKLGALSLLKKIFAEQNASLDEEGEGHYSFTYGYGDGNQEVFLLSADDEHVNVRLVDFCWHEVSKWDIEEVTRIQSLVNNYNTRGSGKVVYSFEDDDKMKLSSIVTFPLYEDIPHIDLYFNAMVDGLIQSHLCIMDTPEAEEAEDADSDDATDNNNEKGGEA